MRNQEKNTLCLKILQDYFDAVFKECTDFPVVSSGYAAKRKRAGILPRPKLNRRYLSVKKLVSPTRAKAKTKILGKLTYNLPIPIHYINVLQGLRAINHSLRGEDYKLSIR